MKRLMPAFILPLAILTYAQNPNLNYNKFEQLNEQWPAPNNYRTAAGAPGHQYWQQKADYHINVVLDDDTQTLSGSETIHYHNQSPDILNYLWLQLDQNVRAKDSDKNLISTSQLPQTVSTNQLNYLFHEFDGGFKIDYVRDNNGNPLPHVIVKTMMRIDLPTPLQPGQSYSFQIKWRYNINDRLALGGRSGYEYFPEDENYLYTIAQFYPRMCVYNDVDGWQNKQFLGTGEFTLPFGDFDVSITVPSDHLVAATGTLTNSDKILSKSQLQRIREAASSFIHPVIIATQEEAQEREKSQKSDSKTWNFTAKNVRDFAFASSRKFIWDAMAVKIGNKTTMAMSMYPKEGNPLWERYSTKAVAHTLKWYSHYSIEYPYPVAWSINADRIGMEYPMISFNFGRCEKDGTYSELTKYGMISVIIHEVGHNFFPMIVNSDERQWTWMDEGLNSFLQFLTEQHWERNYPSRRGPADKIVDYMAMDKNNLTPIMTNSELILQLGNNAYAKAATGLNILRESILGRELFDYAFKEYSRRWAFKHPTPYDFFRTMEDASGIDLDWFWRGWFYTTDHSDQSITQVRWLQANTPEQLQSVSDDSTFQPENISSIRNRSISQTYDEIDTTLRDFYSVRSSSPDEQSELEKRYYLSLNSSDRAVIDQGYHFYELTLENKGGLVMPVILRFTYEDGSNDIIRIPAEIWNRNNEKVTKVFPTQKKVKEFILDPFLETADIDRNNNFYPPRQIPSKFDLYKSRTTVPENEMQKARRKSNKGT
jgi:hypothetical protein